MAGVFAVKIKIIVKAIVQKLSSLFIKKKIVRNKHFSVMFFDNF